LQSYSGKGAGELWDSFEQETANDFLSGLTFVVVVTLQVKTDGGISFNATCKLTHLDEHLCRIILHEYRIHNADILIREDATAGKHHHCVCLIDFKMT
jgi:hypothetical protein